MLTDKQRAHAMTCADVLQTLAKDPDVSDADLQFAIDQFKGRQDLPDEAKALVLDALARTCECRDPRHMRAGK